MVCHNIFRGSVFSEGVVCEEHLVRSGWRCAMH